MCQVSHQEVALLSTSGSYSWSSSYNRQTPYTVGADFRSVPVVVDRDQAFDMYSRMFKGRFAWVSELGSARARARACVCVCDFGLVISSVLVQAYLLVQVPIVWVLCVAFCVCARACVRACAHVFVLLLAHLSPQYFGCGI